MAKAFIPPLDFEFNFEPADITKALEAAGAYSDDDGQNFIPAENLYAIPGYNMRVGGKNFDSRVKFLEGLIELNGFDQTKPLAVMAIMIDGKPTVAIHDGYHRVPAVINLNARAAKGKKIRGVPVKFITDLSPRKLMAGLITANSGEPPQPYEAAIVVHRMLSGGAKAADIAAELGTSRRWIDDLILLSTATPKVRDMLLNGHLSATTLIEELRNYSPADVEKRLLAAQKAQTAAGKTKVTAKALKDVKTSAAPKSKRKSAKAAKVPETAVTDFIALFEELRVAADGSGVPYMEIAFADGVGYAATILSADRQTDPNAAVLAQGTAEDALTACFNATQDHAQRILDEAAADL